MKKLLMAFVLASVIAAVLRALAGQRAGNAEVDVAAPGSGNGSPHHRRTHEPGAGMAGTIDDAVEVSAAELSNAPIDRDVVEGVENN